MALVYIGSPSQLAPRPWVKGHPHPPRVGSSQYQMDIGLGGFLSPQINGNLPPESSQATKLFPILNNYFFELNSMFCFFFFNYKRFNCFFFNYKRFNCFVLLIIKDFKDCFLTLEFKIPFQKYKNKLIQRSYSLTVLGQNN